MNHSRPILNLINATRVYMSTKARIPTHYETLQVQQDCTQDDIKSAYYDLSKKYHPDKNKSEDAKKQFQSVSDAYEVLGNFSKRIQYDRDLSARGQNAIRIRRPPDYEMKEDPLAGFYRSRIVNIEHERAREKRANFDFDTWTQAHYGETLRRTFKDKRSKFLRQEMLKAARRESEQDKHGFILVFVVLVLICIALEIQSWNDKYDKNLIAERQSSKNK